MRIVNLGVVVDGRKILQNVNLYIQRGQTFALFGPNGSGKSTLLMAIAGHPKYRVYDGRIIFKGVDITEKPADERIRMGLGIAYQHPPKVTGVKLREIVKHCAKLGKTKDRIDEYVKMLKMENLLDRDINVGFSGGEVKRSELLQLLLMNPDFVMLDEPDSGVDLENIAVIGEAIKELLERDKKDRSKSGIIITHTGQILKFVDADYGVIIYKGRIACIGDSKDILKTVEKYGYEECVRRCLKTL